MATYYLDYVNGSDAADGSSWANAWKTITNGATTARIAPGDVIRIAKSPAPYSIGNGTWTNLNKAVTIASAQTATVDLCETAWTQSANITATRYTIYKKEGNYSASIVFGASFTTGKAAYYATGALDLSAYQKLSFWIRNSAAVTANYLKICLCSDNAGAVIVDTFFIPAIPSTNRWLPLTITKDGGGNLGNNINSIAIYADTDPGTPTILLDNFIACTTSGLNLQSLISKNTLEQSTNSVTSYGNEGWYGIQSIVGTTILLDNDTESSSTAGRGYITSGTSPETVTTYARETIKTALASSATTVVQAVQDSGTLADGNIEFQGGYDTGTSLQTGETFFDGLNGNGYGIQFSSRVYCTLNYLNFSRYNYAIYLNNSSYNTFTNINNINNSVAGLYLTTSSSNNTFTLLNNANNNSSYGIYFSGSHYNEIKTLNSVNNNIGQGVYHSGLQNKIILLNNARNNGNYGVYFTGVSNNLISTLSTSNNVSGSIYHSLGINYIGKATLSESTKFTGSEVFGNSRLNVNYLASTGYSYIYTDNGNIVSQAATGGGTGNEWKLSPTNSARNSYYPLILDIAKIAVNASALVTVKAYFKKSHATDIGAQLVCRGGQIAGVASDVTATCSNDTNRNELTITFTPTEAGVVVIQAWAYWLANTADEYVLVDDMTISQA